jgi:hypothetical protein
MEDPDFVREAKAHALEGVLGGVLTSASALSEIAADARRHAREQAAVAMPIRAHIAALIDLALFTYPETTKDERARLERISTWFYERGVERGMAIARGELG